MYAHADAMVNWGPRGSTLTLFSQSFEMTMTPARTFSGRNHRVMGELDDLEMHGEAWSTALMSFAELKTLASNISQSGSEH
jgi:hypothetical protein